MTFQSFITSIFGGSIVLGPIVFAALERMAWFANLTAEAKRWVVAGASGGIGTLAWVIALLFGYVDQPAVVSAAFVVDGVWTHGILTGYATFMSATLLHGHYALSKPIAQDCNSGV
ncbi:MAG: hypothetical protein IPP13_21695 [Kouleothrix sp.]|nr:hypothetical protein [Kouleothrix sp.]